MHLLKPVHSIDELIWRYYSSSFEHSWKMENPHHHDAVEFIYVAEGSCRLHFAHNVSRPVKNDLIVVSSNSVHSCDVTEKQGCTLINIHLLFRSNISDTAASSGFFSPFLSTILSKDSFIRFSNCIDLHRVIKNIVEELEEAKPHYESIVVNEVENMLVLLCRKYNSRSGISIHSDCSPYVRNAVQYIENSLTGDLSVGAIADAAHISPDYLMHLFREELNQSVMEIVRRKRIDYACELLSSTGLKVIDIAAEAGFSNAQHFSTVFRKYSDGLSPRDFRKKSRQLNNSDENIFR